MYSFYCNQLKRQETKLLREVLCVQKAVLTREYVNGVFLFSIKLLIIRSAKAWFCLFTQLVHGKYPGPNLKVKPNLLVSSSIFRSENQSET